MKTFMKFRTHLNDDRGTSLPKCLIDAYSGTLSNKNDANHTKYSSYASIIFE